MHYVRYLKQVLYKKLFDVRTYVLLILQSYIMYIYMKPVVSFSQAAQHRVTPWSFPFVISNIYFVFLFMLGIVYFFSDVPFMQYHNMYQIIRTGRKAWAVGHIAAIIIQSFLIMLFNFLISVACLRGYCDYSLDWGKVLHTVALTNAANHYGFLFSISYDTMQRFSAVQLTMLTIGLGSLVICFIGLFMFAVSLIFNRVLAISLSAAMVVMMYFVENIHPLLAKKMSMFVPVGWIRTANIGIKVHDSYMMPSIRYMLVMLVVGIVILCISILWRINSMEFQWNKED